VDASPASAERGSSPPPTSLASRPDLSVEPRPKPGVRRQRTRIRTHSRSHEWPIEIGGTLGIAIYASIATAASGGIFVGTAATAGIAHAFLIGGYVALVTSVAAIVLLPAAKTFLPKMRLNPQAIAAH
jgi:hypothetical protein